MQTLWQLRLCLTHALGEVNGEDEELALAEIEAAIRSGLGEGEVVAESSSKPITESSPTPVMESQPAKANMLKGVGAAPCIAIGPVFQFQRHEISLDEVPDGLVMGWEGLQDALVRAREQLDTLNHDMTEKGMKAEAAIFDAHRGLLDDPELADAVQARIQKGQDALKAWKETIEDSAVVVAALNDPILSARADDLRDGKAVSISLLAPNTGKKHAVQAISIISRISNRLRRSRERFS